MGVKCVSFSARRPLLMSEDTLRCLPAVVQAKMRLYMRESLRVPSCL
jgi:hypothetical protein